MPRGCLESNEIQLINLQHDPHILTWQEKRSKHFDLLFGQEKQQISLSIYCLRLCLDLSFVNEFTSEEKINVTPSIPFFMVQYSIFGYPLINIHLKKLVSKNW